MRLKQYIIERSDCGDIDSCWNWNFSLQRNGYGKGGDQHLHFMEQGQVGREHCYGQWRFREGDEAVKEAGWQVWCEQGIKEAVIMSCCK